MIHQMDGQSTHQMTSTKSYLHYKVFLPFLSTFNMSDKRLLKFALLKPLCETLQRRFLKCIISGTQKQGTGNLVDRRKAFFMIQFLTLLGAKSAD